MIEAKVVLDQVEVTQKDDLQVRLHLLLVEDGVILQQKNHRTSVEKGSDIGLQVQAVNQHLGHMGYPPLEDFTKIEKIARAIW